MVPLVKNLSQHNVDVENYIIQIATQIMKYDPGILIYPESDPLDIGEKIVNV
jgi:hypothetical protein